MGLKYYLLMIIFKVQNGLFFIRLNFYSADFSKCVVGVVYV